MPRNNRTGPRRNKGVADATTAPATNPSRRAASPPGTWRDSHHRRRMAGAEAAFPANRRAAPDPGPGPRNPVQLAAVRTGRQALPGPFRRQRRPRVRSAVAGRCCSAIRRARSGCCPRDRRRAAGFRHRSGACRATGRFRFPARQARSPFDIVFLDPPYTERWLARPVLQLEAGGWLKPGAFVYLEDAAAHGPPDLPEAGIFCAAKRPGTWAIIWRAGITRHKGSPWPAARCIQGRSIRSRTGTTTSSGVPAASSTRSSSRSRRTRARRRCSRSSSASTWPGPSSPTCRTSRSWAIRA